MYFYQESDTGIWILGEHKYNTVVAGSCRLVTGNSTSSIKIKTIASGEVLANGLPATGFKKADGTYYETFNELYDAVWPFFASTTNNLFASTFRGAVSGGSEITSGQTSAELTYTASTEGVTVLKWQYSVAPFDTWVDIENDLNTYTSGALTVETMFRVVGQYGDLIFPSTYTTVTIALPVKPDGITGDTKVAPASQQVYSVTTPAGDALSYVWTVPTNWVITDGQGTDEITVTTGGLTDDGYITVTAVNSRGSSDAAEIAVLIDAVPAQPGVITGTTPQIHETAGEKYSVTNVVGVTYAWTVPTGWSITAGDTTNEITVTTGAYGQNGNITVTATNDYGTSVARTKAVTIGAAPAQPSVITGLETQEPAATGQIYSVTNVAGMTYNWTLPANWVKTAGGTTNEITVTVGGVDDDGDISVTATNDYGTSIARTLTVSVEEGS